MRFVKALNWSLVFWRSGYSNSTGLAWLVVVGPVTNVFMGPRSLAVAGALHISHQISTTSSFSPSSLTSLHPFSDDNLSQFKVCVFSFGAYGGTYDRANQRKGVEGKTQDGLEWMIDSVEHWNHHKYFIHTFDCGFGILLLLNCALLENSLFLIESSFRTAYWLAACPISVTGFQWRLRRDI